MKQSCFACSALLPIFVTLGDETCHPLESEQPAQSLAEIVGLDDEGNVVRAEAFFGVELCLEKDPSLLYAEKELSVSKEK